MGNKGNKRKIYLNEIDAPHTLRSQMPETVKMQ